MVQSTKATGKMTSSMVRARRAGLTRPNSQASTKRVARMDWGSTYGPMEHSTRVSGSRMRLRGTGTISGATGGSTSVTGKATSWMNSAYTLGKMAGCTKGFTKKIRSTDMEFTHGLIRKSTQVGGVKESSMA